MSYYDGTGGNTIPILVIKTKTLDIEGEGVLRKK
jgi:hypothetical protein